MGDERHRIHFDDVRPRSRRVDFLHPGTGLGQRREAKADAPAVDRDPDGIQGHRVSQTGPVQVWVKPLSGGRRSPRDSLG